LTSISITQAIPAEVLPLKFRSLSQGLCFIAGSLGGLYVLTIRFVEYMY
jgi:hypothetical protein